MHDHTLQQFYLSHQAHLHDSTTAGSQRLALTFPPSSAEAAAAELVRLYVQKGHNHHACHRFLKKRRSRRLVCVHPWTKGFFQPIHLPLVPPPTHKQGVQAAHPVLHQRRHWMRAGDIDLGRQIDVPAEFFTRCYSTLPRFVSWFFMIPLTNPPPRPCDALQPTLSVRSFSSAAANNVQQYGFADLCTFPFPRLPSQRGN